MKTDIDQLMGEANLDALLVSGPAGHNPYMTYFTPAWFMSPRAIFSKSEGMNPFFSIGPWSEMRLPILV